jgi:hypothetical protein
MNRDSRFPHPLSFAAAALVAVALTACSLSLNPKSLGASRYDLPFEASRISYHEITYDRRLERVVVPAAETGLLVLVDPVTANRQVISGFSTVDTAAASVPATGEAAATGGGAAGAVSAVGLGNYLFAIDRGAKTIRTVDLAQGRVVSATQVSGVPDLIRYVPTTRELWVTVKELHQIEVFDINEGEPPLLAADGVIPVEFGPEDLLIEEGRGLAYTNQPQSGTTTVIQVITKGKIAEWGNGCSIARGMAIDEAAGYLFIACEEGKLVMMDVHTGFQLASQNYGGGLNRVAYNPRLKHAYLPSGASGILAVFGVEPGPAVTAATATPLAEGAAPPPGAPTVHLERLGTADTVVGANSVTVDGQDQVWVADPTSGRLIVIKDTFPASGTESGETE